MTDNEIIKALECCRDSVRNGGWKECLRCPAGSRKWELCDASRNCIDDIMTKNIDLLNRQKAEIEELQKYKHDYYVLKAEAIKEFAERLKEKAFTHERPFEANEDRFIKLVAVKDIDNLVVEMVGDQNA